MKDHPSQWIASGLACRDIADRTTDYMEDRLPILTRVRVGLHLASCAGCRTYVKQLALISETVKRLPQPIPHAINRLRLRRQFAGRYGPASLAPSIDY